MSMTELDPAHVVRDAIVKVLGVTPERASDPEARIIEDLGGDSLDNVEIAMEIEDDLRLDLLQADLDDAKTVADLVRLTGEAIATISQKGKAA